MEILKTIAYFSIFQYPLTKEELLMYSKGNPNDLLNEIQMLLEKSLIYKLDRFYYSKNDYGLVSKRLQGNHQANNVIPKAFKMGRFISKFPFVKSVSLSGALSKGYYDNKGDFDFFIITSPKRLWIARTLLVLYKKLFLFNSKKYFCINYFVSSDHLKIAEQNRFTATEIITLIPITGKDTFVDFLQKNYWVNNHFTNLSSIDTSQIREIRKPMFTRLLELIFRTKLGSGLDNYFRKFTLKRWQRKFGHLSSEDFKIAMKSTKTVSKHHPQNFQKKVLDAWADNYNELIQQTTIAPLKQHA